MAGKGDDGPKWKALLAAATANRNMDERIAAAQPLAAQVKAVLTEHAALQPGSQKLFAALGVSALNTCVAGLDPAEPLAFWQLLAVNDALVACEPRLAVVLVEHQFLNSLTRLHKRIGDLSHPLSQAVILLLCTVTLLAGEASGSLEGVASRPEVAELLLSHLVFLSLNPAVLQRPSGTGTAQRCLQLCWELTRSPSPHCKGLRELLQRMDLAGRLMQLADAALHGGAAGAAAPGGADSAAAEAAAAIATMAALEDRQGGAAAATAADAAAGSAASAAAADAAATLDPSTYEDRLSLAGQACSLMANLGGLGSRGVELSAAGLAPQRAWLLRRGTLAAMRPALEGLVEGLGELRRRMAAAAPGEEEEAERREEEEARRGADVEAELRAGRVRRARLLDQVEGAARNVLMLIGLPTIVMGRSEAEAVEGCSFVIRLSFELFKEGYVDTMRALREAVADPRVGPASGSGHGPEPFTTPYPGDYGPFFRAYAGHVETMAVALGVQLEDWGVRFTGEQLERDLPVMEVAEGVDVRIAHSWLRDQIQQIIDWGHTMMTLVRMADQAKMDRRSQPAGGAAAAAQGGVPAAPPTAPCAACDAAPPASGPPFQCCSRCRGVRYCSRACQVGHWRQHKGECRGPAAGAVVAGAGSAGAATGAGPGQ